MKSKVLSTTIAFLFFLFSIIPLFSIASEIKSDTTKANSLSVIFSLQTTDAPPPAELKIDLFAVSSPQAFTLNASHMRPAPNLKLKTVTTTGNAIFEANLILMVGLNAADYFSTRNALKYPGLEESNPMMKPFVKSPAAFAAIKLGTTALSYWSLKSLFHRNRTAAWVLSSVTNTFLSYIVFNNLKHIRMAKARLSQ